MRGCIKGELILMTQGSYSDYSVDALVRAERDFTREDTVAAWADDTGRKISSGNEVIMSHNDPRIDYLPWLIVKGYVIEVDFKEFLVKEDSDVPVKSLYQHIV